MRTNSVKLFLNLDNWFRRCCLKTFLIWSSCGPFVQWSWTNFCNFGRGHYEEQFCEFISNLDQWFRRCCLKDFLSGALGALLFIYALLKEGIMGNIHVKLYEIWQWLRSRCRFKKKLRHNGWQTKTDHNSSSWASGSGELKTNLEHFAYRVICMFFLSSADFKNQLF